MTCETPPIKTPNTTENYTIKFNIGFILEGVKEYEELNETKHNISLNFQVVQLNPIKVKEFPMYDPSSKEPLDIQVFV